LWGLLRFALGGHLGPWQMRRSSPTLLLLLLLLLLLHPQNV
jgi:hypothetical protein